MTQPILPYGRQSIDQTDIDAVVACLQDDFLTQGPRVAAFEEALCEATGAAYAVSVTSGTAALHLGALALNITAGDVGVVAPITFVASANAVRYVGGQVAFCDADPRTGLMDMGSLEAMTQALAAQGKAPKVLVPVDLAGQPVDLAAVRSIADAVGAKVIHDAAHSLGAQVTHQGVRKPACGTGQADLSILSFHPVKHITTAEGGAVLTDDKALYERLRDLRSHGVHKHQERFLRTPDDPFVGPWYYEQDQLGFNYRLPDVLCALGTSQLKRLDAFVARRREIAALYGAGLKDAGLLNWIKPLDVADHQGHAYHLFVAQLVTKPGESLNELAARRKTLYLSLREQGILTQVHYIPVPWQPDYKDSALLPTGGTPGADAYYAASLSLPMFPKMHNDDVKRVLDALLASKAALEKG